MKILAIAILAAVFTVAGCANKDAAPVVVTREVKVAVPVPCTVELKGQRPELLTWEQMKAKLDAAPNVDTKAQLITSQLLAHIGWLPVVEDAIKGCRLSPSVPSK